MTTSTHRIVVVFKLPTNVPALIKVGEASTAAILGNAYFGTLQSLLPGVNAKIAALDSAETAAKTRAKGTIAARNNARNDVVTGLHALKAGVQAAAEADPEHADAIVASAGMALKRVPVRVKAPFAVRPGPVSGSAHLSARAPARRASYDPPEFDRRLQAALAELDGPELENLQALIRWFSRRYPTARERLRYARRKHDEWRRWAERLAESRVGAG